MKFLPVALLVLAITPARDAVARDPDGPSITIKSCCTAPSRWADRQEPDEIVTAITTEDGGVTLLLTDQVAAVQLSDRSMRKVRHKLKKERKEEEDNALAQAIKSAVLSGVGSLLDHSVECRIRDLRSVDYRKGRLVLTTNDGDRIFESIEVDDRDVLECFSERDAQQFVSEFRRLKRR